MKFDQIELLYLIGFTLLIFGCGENTTVNNDRPSLQEVDIASPDDDVDIEEKLTVHFGSYNGFTVGNGVRLREKANVKSAKLAELKNGTLLKISEETAREIIGSDRTSCNGYGYPWVKVELPTGQEGWIYAKYVHQMIEKGNKGISAYVGTIYKFDDEPYEFGVGRDYSYPVSDDEGMTGCDDEYIPFFYKKDDIDVRPIYLKNNTKTRDHLELHANGYWQLVESDGRSDEIKRILPILYGIRLTHQVGFQDGNGSGEVDVILKNGRFQADVIKYKMNVDNSDSN